MIFCLIRYSLSFIRMNYYATGAQVAYRTAFISAAITYGIVVYKTLRAKAKANKMPASAGAILSLVGDENVQYLSTWPYHSYLCYLPSPKIR